jgi:hypothetical protein
VAEDESRPRLAARSTTFSASTAARRPHQVGPP